MYWCVALGRRSEEWRDSRWPVSSSFLRRLHHPFDVQLRDDPAGRGWWVPPGRLVRVRSVVGALIGTLAGMTAAGSLLALRERA